MGPLTTPTSPDAVELKLTSAIELMETTCNSKLPADPFYRPQWSMAGIHAAFFIGLRNMYKLALTLDPKDAPDFIQYCLYWVAIMHEHHHIEESWFMAELKGAISLPQIKEEHGRFLPEVDDMQRYLVSCLPKGAIWGPYKTVVEEEKAEDFSGAKLRNMILALVLGGDFIQHLSDEIVYLDPARLRGSGLTDADLTATDHKIEEHLKTEPASVHVYVVHHAPKGAFPPAPWILKNVVFKYFLYWPSRRVFRFCPGPSNSS